MDQTALTTSEAVLLAHGLVQRLADDVGARVLFIKGPTAVAVGARPPRPSSDVDVLVDPASFETLCTAIEGLGWVRRPVPLLVPHAADIVLDHSATFVNEHWPCDLDVHCYFPGFLTDATAAFDALWRVRTEVLVASVPVGTPGLLGQALVVGLHALRDPARITSAADLDHLATVLGGALDEQGRQDLSSLAMATGSEQTARAVLEAAGVATTRPVAVTADLHAWRLRQEFATVPGSMWLVELRRAPWRERPRALANALFFPHDLLLGPETGAKASRARIVRLHLRRWGRGLRALPHALRILGQLRGSADR